jgi:hypothetical protein
MARRLSRGRLFTINAEGQANPNSAGDGIKDSFGSQSNLRQGAEIITEFKIDLGNATAPASSFASEVGTALSAVIGVSSSSGTHDNANVILVSKATHGVVSMVELICVETPGTGEDAIGLFLGNNASGSGADTGGPGATTLIASANQSEGIISAGIEVDGDIDGKYLYLASSGSTAGVYSAGKFVLRLFGYEDFADV